jgi:tRNA A-37 threonylcarbamoyl transferase component Bud32
MGTVYKAEHLLMKRPVALKVINRELVAKAGTIERFSREVRAAARLTHPNIVTAFDAEQASDLHFLVMEYVDGVSLARRVAETGPLPVAEACDYVQQAALGLQHAHECGMVHRDIKPQNLMLTPSGQVKILDFGLARFAIETMPASVLLPAENERPIPSRGAGPAVFLTEIGMVMGTPDFIAPEQACASHTADIRADIYSLGCTLYGLLAGHPPFPEGTAVEKVKAHMEGTPKPLRDIRRDVPPHVIWVVERMMAKDPADRFQTPAEVAEALAPSLVGAAKPPRRKRWFVVTAAMSVAATFLASVIIYVQTDKGKLIIETNDDNITVMIRKAGGVKIVDQASQREYLLQPGEQDVRTGNYKIDVSDAIAGLQFDVNDFKLTRGKEVRLTATFVPEGMAVDRHLPTDRGYGRQRLAALKEIAAEKEKANQNQGAASMEEVIEAKLQVRKAELELCESNKARVAVHEKIVALLKELEALYSRAYEVSAVPHSTLLKVKAERLKAETALERATGKAATQSK